MNDSHCQNKEIMEFQGTLEKTFTFFLYMKDFIFLKFFLIAGQLRLTTINLAFTNIQIILKMLMSYLLTNCQILAGPFSFLNDFMLLFSFFFKYKVISEYFELL